MRKFTRPVKSKVMVSAVASIGMVVVVHVLSSVRITSISKKIMCYLTKMSLNIF